MTRLLRQSTSESLLHSCMSKSQRYPLNLYLSSNGKIIVVFRIEIFQVNLTKEERRCDFQTAISQLCNFPSGNFPSLLQPQRSNLAHPNRSSQPSWYSLRRFRPLGSCRLRNCTFGSLLLGKLSLGKSLLGKYPTP